MTETIITGLFEHGKTIAVAAIGLAAAWALYRDLADDWRADDPRPETKP